jgi:hypothetical protein
MAVHEKNDACVNASFRKFIFISYRKAQRSKSKRAPTADCFIGKKTRKLNAKKAACFAGRGRTRGAFGRFLDALAFGTIHVVT